MDDPMIAAAERYGTRDCITCGKLMLGDTACECELVASSLKDLEQLAREHLLDYPITHVMHNRWTISIIFEQAVDVDGLALRFPECHAYYISPRHLGLAWKKDEVIT